MNNFTTLERHRMTTQFRTIAVAVMLATTLATPGAAQAPAQVADLVGARGAGGETALQSRGYTFVRVQDGDDRKWSYWWNASRRECISVVTMDGRYASITASPAPDCRQRDGGNHPDIGYQSGPPQREAPSYTPQREAPSYTPQPQIAGRQVSLGLVCFGDGQRPALATSYGWSWNSRRDRYDFGNRTELTSQQFDASITIQLWAGGGRVRLPKKLIPPINSRGNDGWWDLYDVSVQPDTIHARYRLNGLNKPGVTIDRRSGQITIQGTAPYLFRGVCDVIDGRDHRRF